MAPRQWDDGCTEVSDLTGAVWRNWGSRTAIALGYHQLDDCVPNCARGTVKSYRAQATAFRIQTCNYEGERYRAYTRIRIRYTVPRANPFGLRAGWQGSTFQLKCE